MIVLSIVRGILILFSSHAEALQTKGTGLVVVNQI